MDLNASLPTISSRGSRHGLDGHGFRLRKDWANETQKQIGRAGLSIDFSDKTRNVAHVAVDRGLNVTAVNDGRVERALDAKINQTQKLMGYLENNIESTNIELQKMHGTKKYLSKEREKVERHAHTNIDRRGTRAQRPAREHVHDIPHRELRRQGDLLQESTRRYVNKAADVDHVIHSLRNIREDLINGLKDKARGIELDRQCMGMVTADASPDSMGHSQLVHGTATGLPLEWKKITIKMADDAAQIHRQAQKTRKKCFHFANRRTVLEKNSHDTLQRSLVNRLNDIHKLKDDLQEQLSHVEEEIAKAQKVKRKLEDAIQEKMPPLNLAKSRYATRTKKPAREAIHDDVEIALLNQYDELKKVVSELNLKLTTVHVHIDNLLKTQQELKLNIEDKIQNFKLEQKIHQLAASRPPTGVTINSNALSIRPGTGSTLGGLTLSRPFNHRGSSLAHATTESM